jgi:CRISPR-associated protein Csm1
MKENKREVRNLLAIGALFHDIGKVIIRAQWGETKEYFKQIEKEKHYKEQFRYTHAFSTYEFLKKIVDNPVILASSYHHNPEGAPEGLKLYAKIYQLADCYSSSERSEKEKKDQESLLRVIFQNIKIPKIESTNQETSLEQEYFYNLQPLQINNEVIFPIKKDALIGFDEIAAYRNLWKSFLDEFNILKNTYVRNKKLNSSEKFLKALYHLIYKYFWCVPASTYDPERKDRHYPDISLFDHLRVCAAFSTSLYTDYNLNIIKNTDKPETKTKLIFLKGDISGIQKFLYGVTNIKGVAKQLRGRSSFLTLLPDLIARALLDKFGYSFVNILYLGGGHFEIVLGYEEGIEKELDKFSKEVEEVLFKNFYGTIGLALGYSEITLSELRNKEVYRNKIMKNIYRILEKSKKQKFKSILINYSPEQLLDIINKEFKEIEKNYTVCPSCQVVITEEKGEEEEKNICKWCETFKEVGEIIPKAKYLIFSKEKLENLYGFYIDRIGGVYFLEELSRVSIKIKGNESIYLLNDTNFLNEKIYDGFKFIAQIVPQTNSEVMTFEELVRYAEGDKKLAFARGDVDNLGLIFMQGLGDDYSISRIATLSRSLDLYFSGYFNYLFNLEEFKNKIYILYSGGDDFFIIGPWDKVVEALRRIREDFKKYTCNNEDIELSSGVFVGRDSYPVRFAGELAGSEEDKAKEIKPAIRVLGESLKWKEYEKAIEEANEMVKLVNEGKIGRSMFYKFYQLLNSFKDNKNRISPKFYPKFYYYLYRNVKDEKDRNQVIRFFLDTENDYQVKQDALFKAKYVLMKTREQIRGV